MADRLTPDEIAAIRDAVHNGTPNAANLRDANAKAGQYWTHARSMLAHAAALETESASMRNPWMHHAENEPPAFCPLVVSDGDGHFLLALADESQGQSAWLAQGHIYPREMYPFWATIPALPNESSHDPR